MKIHKFYQFIIPIVLVLTIQSCKDDEDSPSTPSTPIVKMEVEMSTLISGSITNTYNPTTIAPLTAELDFTTTSNANVEITVLGNIPVYKNFETNITSHKIPVLGLYAATNNPVVLKVTTATAYATDTIYVQTDSMLSYMPEIIIDNANTALMEPGMNLNTLHITDGTNFFPYPMIYDSNGDIRWFLNFEGVYTSFRAPMELTAEGNLLFESGDAIKEYDFMGREVKSVLLPAGYRHAHHDVIILPNGNYVIPVNKDGESLVDNGTTYPTIEDYMIEIDGNSGALIREWDFKEILDVDRTDLTTRVTSGGTIDWFHQNAVIYDASDNTFVVSGRNQGIVKVDMNNNVKWIMAPHKGWGLAGSNGDLHRTDSLLLTAVDGSGTPYDTSIQNGSQNDMGFDWTWGQHAPVYLPNGNLLVFDNGFNRQFGTSSVNYSRAVEYDINETNKTVKQIWSYGESRGPATFSSIISDVDYLPNTGNILFAPGIMFGVNESRIVELAYPSGTVVFEGTLKFKNERSTGNGFGQFDLTYRAERVSLYN